MKSYSATSIIILFNFFFICTNAQTKKYQIAAGSLAAEVGPRGLVSLTETTNDMFAWPASIYTSLDSCEIISVDEPVRLAGGGIELKRLLERTGTGFSCYLTERFRPADNGLRCEIEIKGTGKPWTAPIKTEIQYLANELTRIWAPWGDLRISRRSLEDTGVPETENIKPGQNWTDPLLPRKFFNDTLFYGAPFFSYEKPGIAFIPFQWNLFCIPMISIFETKDDKGISVILDPSDDILDLTMQIKSNGNVAFSRLFNRISDGNVLKFSFDIVVHEADWRGGLRWMSMTYPEYFNPANPAADEMAGTGAYSDSDTEFDVAKMRRMAFSVNWRASFDFPYMGMFLPPVKENITWTRFGGRPTSVSAMQNYSEKMQKLGFHVLSYFNVTEFGAKMKYPLEPVKTMDQPELWKSANDFLSVNLQGALLHVPDRVPQERLGFYAKTRQGGAYFTWEDGIVMDCGEPSYKEFLIDQAKRHISLIPSSEGICIDRLDWLRMYNENRDDGRSWYIDRPARSLITSWKDLMKELAPLMHNSKKVIFVNNHDKRIDLLKNTDGIFDEFTYAGVPLNLTSLMCINRPALGWTADNGPIKSEGCDNFFQKYIYLGVYPMAPFPGNDHSIKPDDITDSQYEDYGSLLAMMRGKKWVLEPHCAEVEGGTAKVNIFRVPGGFVLPVVFGQKESAFVVVRNLKDTDPGSCMAFYPGTEKGEKLKTSSGPGYLRIEVPLKRGCAMVKIENVKQNRTDK